MKTIKIRLLFYFILTSFLPILMVGFIPYQKSSEVVRTQMLEFAQSAVNQLNENISYHLKEMELMSRIVYYQSIPVLRGEKTDALSENKSDPIEFNKFLAALKNNRTFIDEIHVINGDKVYTTAVKLDTDILARKEWYTSALEKTDEKIWIGPHESDYSINKPKTYEVITLIYPFKPVQSGKTALIMIEMKREKLDELFGSPNLKSLGKLLLIDKYGTVIYSPDRSLILPAQTGEKQYITNTNLIRSLNKDNSFVYDINFFSGWKVGAFIPNEKLEKSFDSIRETVFILLVIFFATSTFLGLTLSNHFTRPLQRLQRDMKQIENGNFHIRSHIQTDDEIGDLSRSFNRMVEEIELLIQKISENEQKKKQVEMKALQYQINPHFLYNTLNSVQWLAKLHKVPHIGDMVTALIKLLRASLNTKTYLHMLEEELEILSYYMKIQRYRFGDNFRTEYNIDPTLLKAVVPRFILQPLVENSFFHAFSDGEGTISIRATRIGDIVKIEVGDNGRGMSEEQVVNILCPEKKKKTSSGIGVKNVDDKIKHYFGANYGLSITSKENEGTTVTIRLPYQLKDREDVHYAQSINSR